MAKPKNDRAKGKKVVEDLSIKDVDTAQAQAVNGGKVSVADIPVTKLIDKASPLSL